MPRQSERTALPLEDPLASFSISTHTYKVVDGHEILVDVLIPKKVLELGPESVEWKELRPISVRLHGGGLVSVVVFSCHCLVLTRSHV